MTIYTITYNEQLMLPYFINHYRTRFPDCTIVIFDNYSTDATEEIAIKNNCDVHKYFTNNKLSDTMYLEIKNNCWKDDKGWIIIADCDEFLDITPKDIKQMELAGETIIRSHGWNMVNMNDDLNIKGIKTGVRAKSYDKAYCFNASKIKEINYAPGAHNCYPEGDVLFSRKVFNAYHYKYINMDYMIKRHKNFALRLSDENKARGYGGHYQYTPDEIKNEFLIARNQSIKLL